MYCLVQYDTKKLWFYGGSHAGTVSFQTQYLPGDNNVGQKSVFILGQSHASHLPLLPVFMLS